MLPILPRPLAAFGRCQRAWAEGLPLLPSPTSASTELQPAEWETRTPRRVAEVVSAVNALEVKIDGMAASISYEMRPLVLGASRGIGLVGEDVTAMLRAVVEVRLRFA